MVSAVLFVIGLNMKISGLSGCQFGKVTCGKGEWPTYSFCLSVCSKEKKRSICRGGHVRHMLYYSTL